MQHSSIERDRETTATDKETVLPLKTQMSPQTSAHHTINLQMHLKQLQIRTTTQAAASSSNQQQQQQQHLCGCPWMLPKSHPLLWCKYTSTLSPLWQRSSTGGAEAPAAAAAAASLLLLLLLPKLPGLSLRVHGGAQIEAPP